MATPDELDFGATLRGFAPGQTVLKRYTLTRLVGRGGMGVVWLARDNELEEEVALKFLPEVISLDREAVGELKREVRRSRELSHPNIVRIHDFVTDGNVAAVSMEYVAGETLSALKVDAPERVLSLAQLQPLLKQLCGALDYAHADAQVVHRDLKPANVMVTNAGKVKILDFGIAASISESASRVSNRGTSGTLTYMSPQQLMGKVPTAADDLYALGATLYELLTGKPPFYRGDLFNLIRTEVPASLAERRAELGVNGETIPAAWENAIAALLAKEPADRPQSGTAVLALLDGKSAGPGLLSGRSLAKADVAVPRMVEPRDAKTPDGAEANASAVRQPSAKKSLWLALGATAVMVLGGLGYYFGVVVPEKARQAEAARLEQVRLEEKTRAEAAAAERSRQAEAQAAAVKTQASVQRLAPAANQPSAAATDQPETTVTTPDGRYILSWRAPSDWIAKPNGAMRIGSYTIPGSAGEGNLAVTLFPGDAVGILDNINRWRGQLGLAPFSAGEASAQTTQMFVGRLQFTVVDFTGTEANRKLRLLGAFLPLGKQTVFFKLTGPDGIVGGARSAFTGLLRSVTLGVTESTATNIQKWADAVADLQADMGKQSITVNSQVFMVGDVVNPEFDMLFEKVERRSDGRIGVYFHHRYADFISSRPPTSGIPSDPVAAGTDFPKEGIVYTIKVGDTLNSIAKNNGGKVSEIIAANKITNPAGLRVGQALFIPQGGSLDRYDLNNIEVSLLGAMGTRHLKASLTLVAADKKVNSTAIFEGQKVKLKDTTLKILSACSLADLQESGAQNILRGKLVSSYNEMFGKRMIDEVYFTEFDF